MCFGKEKENIKKDTDFVLNKNQIYRPFFYQCHFLLWHAFKIIWFTIYFHPSLDINIYFIYFSDLDLFCLLRNKICVIDL